MKVLIIDNFDSFTYNLVYEFETKGCDVLIYRNDITEKQLKEILSKYKPDLIVLSPGPSYPKDAGICIPLIKQYHKKYPILGICLGHQCLIEAFGGKVERAKLPVHGKKSKVTHSDTKLFEDIPNPLYAGRYHSLYGSKVPSFFIVTASVDDIPMAIENSEHNIYGFQFHPESILTTYGSRLIQNVLEMVK